MNRTSILVKMNKGAENAPQQTTPTADRRNAWCVLICVAPGKAINISLSTAITATENEEKKTKADWEALFSWQRTSCG